MASWGHEFHCHVILILYHFFCPLRYLIIQDLLLGYDARVMQSIDQRLVCALHFVLLPALHVRNHDSIAIDLYQHHHVRVSL